MNIGIYIFPQFFKKEEIKNTLEFFSQNSVNQIHFSFNYNYLLENPSIKDLLFFKPDKKYYQKDIKILQYSQNYYDITQEFVECAHDAGFKVIAWLNCLENQNAISNYPDWAQMNQIGEKNNVLLCPNIPSVQNYILNLVTNIIEKFPINGIELYNIRFGYKEGLSCFCQSCQRESAKPNSLEDLKEREIIDETKKGINVKQIQKYFLQKSKLLFSKNLNQDIVFRAWNRFRCNSITRFVGNILISIRKKNQNISLGTDVWPISMAELIGQNYADIATYQDLIYQNLFTINNKNSLKNSQIVKEIAELKKLIEKGRGIKKFYTCININSLIKKNFFKILIKSLQEFNVKGIVLFYYKEENKNKLKYIKESLINGI